MNVVGIEPVANVIVDVDVPVRYVIAAVAPLPAAVVLVIVPVVVASLPFAI